MSNPAPFISDAEYLACESEWLRQRAASIAAQQESKRDRAYGRRYQQHPTDDEHSWSCLVTRLREKTSETRQKINARLEAGARCGGFKLGLDKLQQKHSLSKFERLVMLTTVLTAIDQRVVTAIESLDHVSWVTSPEVMFLLARKGFADRIKLRSVFNSDRALFRHGLVRWSQSVPYSSDLLRERFNITPWALDVVIGTTPAQAC